MWLIKTKKAKLNVKIVLKTEVSRTHLIIQRSKKEKKLLAKYCLLKFGELVKEQRIETRVPIVLCTFSKINTRIHKLPFPFAVLAAKGIAGHQKFFYFAWRVSRQTQGSNTAHPCSRVNRRKGGKSDFIGAEMNQGISRGTRSKSQIRVKLMNKMVDI